MANFTNGMIVYGHHSTLSGRVNVSFKGGHGSWKSTELLSVRSCKLLSLLKYILQLVSMVTNKGLHSLTMNI